MAVTGSDLFDQCAVAPLIDKFHETFQGIKRHQHSRLRKELHVALPHVGIYIGSGFPYYRRQYYFLAGLAFGYRL